MFVFGGLLAGFPTPWASFRVSVFVAAFLSTQTSRHESQVRNHSKEANVERKLGKRHGKMIFVFFLSPLPPGGPGEGPGCHVPKGIGGLGPIPARIRGKLFYYYFGLIRSWD